MTSPEFPAGLRRPCDDLLESEDQRGLDSRGDNTTILFRDSLRTTLVVVIDRQGGNTITVSNIPTPMID